MTCDQLRNAISILSYVLHTGSARAEFQTRDTAEILFERLMQEWNRRKSLFSPHGPLTWEALLAEECNVAIGTDEKTAMHKVFSLFWVLAGEREMQIVVSLSTTEIAQLQHHLTGA